MEDYSGQEMVISRLIDAPRALVFDAWVNPHHLVHWWGPEGFTNSFLEIDIRVGGRIRFTMHGPDGVDYPNRIVYDAIEQPARLEYTVSDDSEDNPFTFKSFVTFEEVGGKTLLTMTARFGSKEQYEEMKKFGAVEGGNSTFNCLEAQLKTMDTVPPAFNEEEFVMTRLINAPRQLVWDAYSKAEHLQHWWGPKGFKMAATNVDFREGGRFHYCIEAGNGMRIWGKFDYEVIEAPARLVFVSAFSDETGGTTRHPMSETWPAETRVAITFSEHGDKTILRMTAATVGANAQERATFIAGHASMQQGNTGTFEQLSEYLASIG